MAGKKNKKFISLTALDEKESKFIDKKALYLIDVDLEGNTSHVFVSLLHLQFDFQCFSSWSKPEMSLFWHFNKEIHSKSWQDVYSTARKKNKTGLAYTIIPKGKYPNSVFTKNLSSDITTFELRVNQKIRVHGFRNKNVFYICWLDKNHDITQ
jgi:hypothetical protein